MSRNSRKYAGAALLAALMSIPVVAQAQTSAAERSLMNQVDTKSPSQVGEHDRASTLETGDQSQASRALLGTVAATRFAGAEARAADSGFPTPELVLLGHSIRPKAGKEN
jgi:hypothetical protein